MSGYVTKIHRTFYHRVRIPSNLRDAFGGRCELKRSLKTTDKKQAKVLAADCRAKVERLFFAMRCGMLSEKNIRKLVDEYFDRTLADADDARVDGVGVLKESKDGEHGVSSVDTLELHLMELKDDLAKGNLSGKGAQSLAESILEDAGVTLEKGSRGYRKLCREALKGAIEATKVELERMQGVYRRAKVPAAPPLPGATSTANGDGEQLSTLIEEYTHECATGGRWRGRTKTEAEGCLSLFLQIVGDRGIKSVSRRDLTAFRDTLRKWPSNATKAKKYRGKTPQEILKIAAKGDGKTLSVTTVNKYLVFTGALFRWAVANGYADTNVADRLSISKRNVRESEEREAYDRNDLKRMLASSIYTTALPHSRPERYFVPLIALLSGMRLAEIAQLHLTDIREEEGVPVFDINDQGDKSLKNAASRRIVPIHPALIDLGLLHYAKKLRAAGELRLWPNLKRTQAGYGQDVGRYLQRWNREEVTENTRKTFHSFRHTVITALNRAHVPEAIVAELAGHSHGSIDRDRYGKGFETGALLDAVKKLEYGLDLAGIPRLNVTVHKLAKKQKRKKRGKK